MISARTISAIWIIDVTERKETMSNAMLPVEKLGRLLDLRLADLVQAYETNWPE
jgi:hypothetical protein